jgi:hypothetical protein
MVFFFFFFLQWRKIQSKDLVLGCLNILPFMWTKYSEHYLQLNNIILQYLFYTNEWIMEWRIVCLRKVYKLWGFFMLKFARKLYEVHKIQIVMENIHQMIIKSMQFSENNAIAGFNIFLEASCSRKWSNPLSYFLNIPAIQLKSCNCPNIWCNCKYFQTNPM